MSLTLKERSQSENWPNARKIIGVTRAWLRIPKTRVPEGAMERMNDDMDTDYIAACMTRPGGPINSGYPIMLSHIIGPDFRKVAGRRFLEIGSGFGELGELIASHGGQFIGVDIDTNMNRVARKVNERFGKNVEIIDGDATDLQAVLGRRKFDFAFCQDSFHHVEDLERVRMSFENLVRFGNRVIVKDFDKDHVRSLASWLRWMLSNPGAVGVKPENGPIGLSFGAAWRGKTDITAAIDGLPLTVQSPVPDMRRHGSGELKWIISRDPVPRHLDERFSWIVRSKK